MLLAVAALTSAIALFEVLVSWGEERGWARPKTAFAMAALCWVIGLLTVFSLSVADNFYPLSFIPGYEKATMFDVIDRATATVGLPLGGLLASLFAGRVMSRQSIADELGLTADGAAFKVWRALMRWLLPAVIALLIFGGVRG